MLVTDEKNALSFLGCPILGVISFALGLPPALLGVWKVTIDPGLGFPLNLGHMNYFHPAVRVKLAFHNKRLSNNKRWLMTY